MTQQDPERLARLGDAVSAFLEFQQSGGQNPEAFLRKHEDLRELLEPMFESDEIPELPDNLAATATSPGKGARILGDFRLLREIGRGGMGIVYEAEQLSLKRRVALKVLPPSLGMSPVTIERLRREAAAAARLSHPGILPIYSVGEADGNHFFAMELVEGESMHEILTAARESPSDRGNLGILSDVSRVREVVDIIAQTAEGLAEAHANGVIHRDVKPHNVLIDRHADERRCVRLVDFGLAKDTDQVTVSGADDVAGTPQYMSPEQIAGLGHVDARSDIFSLGAMMYECLTLRPPFAGDTTHRVMYEVVHADPEPLRVHDASIPHDVEVICAKTMEKKPRDRYATAAEFAADLRRFLDHLPILAEPPGLWRRAKKWTRRHPLAAGSMLMASVLVFGGLGGYFAHLSSKNEALAEEKEQTRLQRDRALAHLNEAQSVLNRVLQYVEELAVLPGLEDSHRRMAEDVVQHLDNLMNDPIAGRRPGAADAVPAEKRIELQLLATRARMRVAQSYLWTGDYETALKHVDIADRSIGEILEHTPGHRTALSYAGTNATARGVILGARNSTEEAIAQLEKSQRIFRELAETAKSREERQKEVLGAIESDVLRGRMMLGRGSITASKRAEALLARAHDALESFGPTRDTDQITTLEEYRLLYQDGQTILLRLASRLTEALRSADQAIAIGRRRVAAFPTRPRVRRGLGTVLRRRAEVRDQMRDTKGSLADFEEARAILRRLVKEFPKTTGHRIELMRCLAAMASLLGRSQQIDEVRKAVTEARTVGAGIEDETHVERRELLAIFHRNSGLAYLSAQQPKLALDEFRAAAKMQEKLIENNPTQPSRRFELAYSLHYVAVCDLMAKRGDAGLAAIDRAIAQQREALRLYPGKATYEDWLRKHLGSRTEILLWMGDHERALEAARHMLEHAKGDGRYVLHAARSIGHCMLWVSIDEHITEADRSTVQDRYAKECLAALRRAVELGYRGVQTLRTAKHYEFMRGRPGFEALLREMQTLREKK